MNSPFRRQWHIGQNILSLTHNRRGDWALGALTDGQVFLVPTDDAGVEPYIFKLHDGAVLCVCADSDAHAFLSGGDDGAVYLIDPQIAAPTLLAQHKGQRIEHVAAGPDGCRAYASGGLLYRLDEEGRPLGHPEVFNAPFPSAEEETHAELLADIKTDSPACCVAPHAHEPLLAVGYENGLILLVPFDGRHEMVILPPLGARTVGLIWSHDGQSLLAAHEDGSVFLFTKDSLSRFIRARFA
ncbi:MAG: WD40 repeat domain-containing protein [Alphaproteobacteria bacterium]|nr:WD40 repeat domain-containing protein [Alphaproteobacteria bacterium]